MPNSSKTNGEKPNGETPPDTQAATPTLEFRSLSGPIRRGSFVCGEREIDQWVSEAHKDHDKLKLRVTTAHLSGNPNVAGLYALRIRLEADKDIDGNDGAFRTEHGYFSAVQLCYVAVQKELQRRGVGRLLMARAIQEFGQVVHLTGACAMTLVAIDEQKANFYRLLGFRPYGMPSKQPKMFLPARTALDLLRN